MMMTAEDSISTSRLLLRIPKEDDAKDMVEGAGNLAVSRYLSVVPHPYTEDDALEFINECITKWSGKHITYRTYAIELKSESKVIGVISLEDIDSFDKNATAGFWLNEKYQKKGFMSEALQAIVSFAFDKLELERINTSVFSDNEGSIKLHLKQEFEREGFKKKSCRTKATGEFKDEIIYGLLKEQWNQR